MQEKAFFTDDFRAHEAQGSCRNLIFGNIAGACGNLEMIRLTRSGKLSPVWAEIGKFPPFGSMLLDLVDEWQHPGLVREKVNLVCRHDYRA